MKYFLGIGLNKVSAVAYQGWTGPLDKCVSDIANIEKMLCPIDGNRGEKIYPITKYLGCGFVTYDFITNEKATAKYVLAQLSALAKIAVKGDEVVVYYSGHGDSFVYKFTPDDTNKEEYTGQDQAWCLYDGELPDDILQTYICLFQEGVNVTFASDSCHSETMYRSFPYKTEDPINRALPYSISSNTAFRTVQRQVRGELAKFMPSDFAVPKCNLTWAAGCADGGTSSETADGGAFTVALIKTLVNSNAKISRNGLQAPLRAETYRTQVPFVTNETPKLNRLQRFTFLRRQLFM